jgi:hypothetical protein
MGTGHLFTRRQLYDLVWAGPISSLAKTLQVIQRIDPSVPLNGNDCASI